MGNLLEAAEESVHITQLEAYARKATEMLLLLSSLFAAWTVDSAAEGDIEQSVTFDMVQSGIDGVLEDGQNVLGEKTIQELTSRLEAMVAEINAESSPQEGGALCSSA